MTYWVNPWKEAISVPIEELAECHAGLGQPYRYVDTQRIQFADKSTTYLLTKENVLEHWKDVGDRLDAYILPQPSGFHSIGIRYGAKDHEYLSPLGDKEKVQALLDKYRT